MAGTSGGTHRWDGERRGGQSTQGHSECLDRLGSRSSGWGVVGLKLVEDAGLVLGEFSPAAEWEWGGQKERT